uniref:Uncharacterized protein n=1 Tax=Chromera velia CCMP2878 TaxID=1169474 RepID=A0A0G4IA42_9ALVE|eukprot:Cvel_12422.t1-p1 / transcript=Cvel_12422.t1 / gene=Cvel_12422 / organism=Chromera_velia_CCMP2878 / gene_product=hypothetical protein / transcript_product=hypothetical protein / location=Cvel_scaffold812:52923-53423(-) / protein_length=167 / sequence_SO=supercontig / SO=protein_coding / is_pseudo=false
MPFQSQGLGDEAVFSCPAVFSIRFGIHDPSGAPKNIVVPCLLHMVDQPNLPDVLIHNAPSAGLFVPRSSTKDVLPAYRAWAERTKEERQISHGVRLSMDLMYQEGVRQGIPQVDVEVMDTSFKVGGTGGLHHPQALEGQAGWVWPQPPPSSSVRPQPAPQGRSERVL